MTLRYKKCTIHIDTSSCRTSYNTGLYDENGLIEHLGVIYLAQEASVFERNGAMAQLRRYG